MDGICIRAFLQDSGGIFKPRGQGGAHAQQDDGAGRRCDKGTVQEAFLRGGSLRAGMESGKSFQETGLEDGKGVCMDIAKWWEPVIGRRNIESFIDQVMRTESGKRITRVTFGL